MFSDNMADHLAEEETFWPPMIKEKGEANMKKVVKKILSENSGKVFEMFCIEIAEAMGCNLRGKVIL
jgi:hypothetical protein